MTSNHSCQPFSDELIDLLHHARGGASLVLTTITNSSAAKGRAVYGILTYDMGEEQRVFHSTKELIGYLKRAQRKP